MARQHTSKTESKRNSNKSKNKNTAKKNLKSRRIRIYQIEPTDYQEINEATHITIQQLRDAFKIT